MSMKWLVAVILVCGGLWAYHHASAPTPMTWTPARVRELTSALRDADGQRAPTQTLSSAKRILVYFSASWCPPCRAFTPELVTYYNTHNGGKAFQLLFVSNDQSAEDMLAYMKDDSMPWWGVPFHSSLSKSLIKAYEGPGIPCLVMLDGTGHVLADSWAGDRYLGPHAVLSALDAEQ